MSRAYDIFDKSDRSIAPTFGGVKGAQAVPKREKNDWAAIDAKGQFRYVIKTQLCIDSRYQRDARSESKIRAIASQFSWALFGALSVVEREDGTLWVFDGGHRARATMLRDDVLDVPCMVHHFATLSDEARAFIGKNLLVSTVKATDKFRAAVTAESDVERKVAAMLAGYGISVVDRVYKNGTVKCVGSLCEAMKEDESLTHRVFAVCVGWANTEPVMACAFRGLFTLCRRFAGKLDVLDEHVDKLLAFDQAEVATAQRRLKVELAKGGSVVEAQAIMHMINKGKRKRLEW